MKLYSNTIKDEIIEPNETYLEIKVITDHDIINIAGKIKSNANNTPKYVATPLPPLNFSQIEKTCPKNTIRQDK